MTKLELSHTHYLPIPLFVLTSYLAFILRLYPHILFVSIHTVFFFLSTLSSTYFLHPLLCCTFSLFFFFFLNDPAPPEISPFPLPDALPISPQLAPPLGCRADLEPAGLGVGARRIDLERGDPRKVREPRDPALVVLHGPAGDVHQHPHAPC